MRDIMIVSHSLPHSEGRRVARQAGSSGRVQQAFGFEDMQHCAAEREGVMRRGYIRVVLLLSCCCLTDCYECME